MFVVGLRGSVVAIFAQPSREQAERVVPERVDLHRFATTRCDDPVPHLRIHPGELITFFALYEQAVVWIDVNVEPRSTQMMFGDVDQNRQKKLQRGAIGGALKITAERVKEPKRCIGGIVSTFLR